MAFQKYPSAACNVPCLFLGEKVEGGGVTSKELQKKYAKLRYESHVFPNWNIYHFNIYYLVDYSDRSD